MLLSLLLAAGPADGAVSSQTEPLLEADTVLPALPGEWTPGRMHMASQGSMVFVVGEPVDPAPGSMAWTVPVEVLDLTDVDAGWSDVELEASGPRCDACTCSHPTHGLLVAGGHDGDRSLQDAFLLQIVPDRRAVARVPLPDLPEAVDGGAATMIGTTAWVFDGGAESTGARLYSLDLADSTANWTTHHVDSSVQARDAAIGGWRDALHIFDGRTGGVWSYSPNDGWRTRAERPMDIGVISTPVLHVGHDYLIPLARDGAMIRLDHAEAWHPITDRWSVRPLVADVRRDAHGASVLQLGGTGTVYDGSIVSIGVPGGRTLHPVLVLRPYRHDALLGALDWVAIIVYGVVLLGMGFYFMRREEGTEDYFLAGGRVPWWAAGISIFATGLSAITFMAIPAKSYDTDWIYFIQNMGVLLVIPAVVWIFLPFFRRLSVTTAYEYLEHRFHVSLRLAGSAIYMLFQVGRVAVVTLLPALALSAVTGFDVTTCILVMGGVCIVYTVLGGIEAVIWSDVLQTVILMGGALWALVVMINGIDGGFTTFMHEASAGAKFRMADVSMDLTRPTLLVIILGAIFTSIIPYASDQSIVQRYMTTRDEAASRRAIWLNGFMTIPASLLFFGLGTALWVYYRANPVELEPTEKLDQILPYFIVDQLPAGVAGLVIAAVFAAAMSSLDSSMNSVSTAFTTDWYRRFRPAVSDAVCLRVARVATISIGIVGTGAALFMAALDDASLLDVWFKVIGLFGSPLAGLFILGVLSRRAGSVAGWCGLLGGVVSVLVASTLTPVSGLIYSVFGIVGCVVVGLLVGAVCPSGRSLEGLTIATMPSEANED